MPCCHHHCCYPWHYWDWPEASPPYPRRYAAPPREAYVHRLEEDRDLLVRRLQRLEQELEELRQSIHPTMQ
jgi:hypothetical protein